MTTPKLRQRLAPAPPRPYLWALVVGLSVAFGILDFSPQVLMVIRLYPNTHWWGLDFDLVLQASRRLLDGQSLYADPGFFYTPLTALLGIPETLVTREYVLVAYAAFNVVLAVAVTRWLTRGSWLAILAVVTFLPLINDIAPGNFMVPITAAMAVATFGAERRRSGVALGLVAAAIPKPLLAPYFLWLLVYRRKAAEGAVITGAVLTLVAAVIVGPGTYLAWFHNLIGGTGYISSWDGNYGVSAYLPTLAVPISILVMVLTVVVVARASEYQSFVWVLAAGIVVSPYAGPLAALPLLLALLVLRPWPRLYAIALLNPVASISVAFAGVGALVLAPLFAIDASQRRFGAVEPETSSSPSKPKAGVVPRPLDAAESKGPPGADGP